MVSCRRKTVKREVQLFPINKVWKVPHHSTHVVVLKLLRGRQDLFAYRTPVKLKGKQICAWKFATGPISPKFRHIFLGYAPLWRLVDPRESCWMHWSHGIQSCWIQWSHGIQSWSRRSERRRLLPVLTRTSSKHRRFGSSIQRFYRSLAGGPTE
jgi:hypothetical protein